MIILFCKIVKSQNLQIVYLLLCLSFWGCLEERNKPNATNTSDDFSTIKTDSLVFNDKITKVKNSIQKEEHQYFTTDTIDFSILQKIYPESDITSGRTNLPAVIPCQPIYTNFGFYNFIEIHSKLKPPVVARALVSFSDIPWRYSSKNQELIRLTVKDSLFKIKFLPFNIGDNVDKIEEAISIDNLPNNILLYAYKNHVVVVKIDSGKICEYTYWNCSLERFKMKIKDLKGLD